MNGKISVLNSIGNVKTLGRTYLDEKGLWLAFSGAGAEFEMTGTACTVTILGDTASTAGVAENYSRIAIEINGERVVDDMIDEAVKTYEVLKSDEEQTATISIIKLSETAMSVCGIGSIEVEGSAVSPTALSNKKIEIIGDSITCGYGIDDPDKDHHFSTETEDVTKSYSYLTASALGADYSMVSISGYGIISGYSGDGEKHPEQTIPQYYDKLGFSYTSFSSGKKIADIEWDFEKFTPDIIVINLGTNDDSYCGTNAEKQTDYKDNYVEFLKTVREKNPNAHILCTLGIMGDRLFKTVETAVEEYSAQSGDTNISTMKFDVQQAADGYSADWHPSQVTQQKAAEKLTTHIEELMGW